MALEAILRPVIKNFEETCKKENEDFLAFYVKDALMIDVSRKSICKGHDEILKQFKEWFEMGKDWVTENTNEDFSGSENFIRYACRCTMKKDGQVMVAFDEVQYWRKFGDKYLMELEQYTLAKN
ncbi:unnamed protein product, partial [Mesorhabditis belari]|uniref:Uncharacterized protein n=1 Tax=Mesorhabditis belari TaxID=2138241 RepID=A0AAF3EPA2_9BILA